MALSDLEVGDEEIEVTRWLEESGRRRVNKEWLEKLATPPPPEPRKEDPAPRLNLPPSTLYLLALTAASYLVFFFTDVELKIMKMRSMVVFVFG
jgi:hypothetical protein